MEGINQNNLIVYKENFKITFNKQSNKINPKREFKQINKIAHLEIKTKPCKNQQTKNLKISQHCCG